MPAVGRRSRADEKTVVGAAAGGFAGFLDHTDAQIGRLVDYLESIGELDNTLSSCCSDNGASQEGGPGGSHQRSSPLERHAARRSASNLARARRDRRPAQPQQLPVGLGEAGNTPLKRYKQNTHEGGVRAIR